MALEITKELTRSNALSFFHKNYSEVAKSDPLAFSTIFRQEVNRRYDSLTVTETNDLFNRVVNVNKPQRCFELACCLTALAITAGIAGLFFSPFFFLAIGFLLVAMISAYKGISVKKENIQLVDQYVRGLVHRDRAERNDTGVSADVQLHRRLDENRMTKLGQECLTKLGHQVETLTSREIADKLEILKTHFAKLNPDQKELIEAFVIGKLDSQSTDCIQTLADTIRADRTNPKSSEALQFGALATILLSKHQPLSSVLENQPIPSRYDDLLGRLAVTPEVGLGSELVRAKATRELILSVHNQDIALTDLHGQTTPLKTSRDFTISTPDSQGHVHVKVSRSFNKLEVVNP